MEPYRSLYPGVRYGKNVTIFPGAVIGRPPLKAGAVHQMAHADVDTIIGDGTVIGANAVIYQGVVLGKSVMIGDGVTIRENCHIGDQSIIGNNSTLQNDVRIGKRSRVIDLSHITAGVEIGDDVFISTGVLTMNDNSLARGGELRAPKIADNARVGGGAILLPGVEVGKDALVAAGAVVTRNVAAETRVQGVPAHAYPRERSEWDDPDQLWLDYFFGT